MSDSDYVHMQGGKVVPIRTDDEADKVLNLCHGDKVVCSTVNAGYPADKKLARSHLQVGQQYTVDRVKVGRNDSSMWIEEVPGKEFNTVFFMTPSDYEARTDGDQWEGKVIHAAYFPDIVEKNGKTVRENNMVLCHRIPIGAMVEVDCRDVGEWHGCRLFVVKHCRDCDGTPLYALGRKGEDNPLLMTCNGWSEDSLRVIRNPDGSDGDTEQKMTFGDLEIGDRFIVLPTHGDNDGHGGYLGDHYLMEKTGRSYLPGVTERRENACVVGRGAFSSLPAAVEVIRVSKLTP